MHLALLLAALARAAVVVEPPPGWTDVTSTRPAGDVVASLKGPETSSFVLTRIEALDLDNRAVVRGLLFDVLRAMEARRKLGLRATSNLISTTFSNGVTAHYIKAEGKQKEKLILAVARVQGETVLATLVSAVPDTILPSLIGGIRAGRAAAQTASSDGQLDFAASGLAPRALTPKERKSGFVAALTAEGNEVLVLRLSEDGTPLSEQPEIVRQTALAIPGAAAAASPARRLATPAGPEAVYAAAGPAAAGYLPWAYWGYSVLAKGPQAEDALVAALSGAAAGPGADLKLVGATPRVPVKGGVPRWAALLAGLAFAASVAAWWRKRNTLT